MTRWLWDRDVKDWRIGFLRKAYPHGSGWAVRVGPVVILHTRKRIVI